MKKREKLSKIKELENKLVLIQNKQAVASFAVWQELESERNAIMLKIKSMQQRGDSELRRKLPEFRIPTVLRNIITKN